MDKSEIKKNKEEPMEIIKARSSPFPDLLWMNRSENVIRGKLVPRFRKVTWFPEVFTLLVIHVVN